MKKCFTQLIYGSLLVLLCAAPPALHAQEVAEPQLGHNYPNPFQNSTIIPFVLKQPTHAAVRIYDLLGNQVAVVLEADLPAGPHTCEWATHDAPGGFYFCRLTTSYSEEVRRMTLVRQ